ncbi:MAG: hypothetical protein M0P74_08925 [Syntrophales bacterium]|jgi:hypothetical protein|nr:hypothetical protein [Syntrophales bacterium]
MNTFIAMINMKGIVLGWPMSSWIERLSIGVMIYNLMKLPRLFPKYDFDIEYCRRPSTFRDQNSEKGRLTG